MEGKGESKVMSGRGRKGGWREGLWIFSLVSRRGGLC